MSTDMSVKNETALAQEKLKTEQEKGKYEADNAKVHVYELLRTSEKLKHEKKNFYMFRHSCGTVSADTSAGMQALVIVHEQ